MAAITVALREVEEEDAHGLPFCDPGLVMISYVRSPTEELAAHVHVTLADLIKACRHEAEESAWTVLREAVDEAALAPLPSRQRVLVLVLVAEVFGDDGAYQDEAVPMARRALLHMRALDPDANARLIAHTLSRTGRVLAYAGSDTAERREGVALMNEAASHADSESRGTLLAAAARASAFLSTHSGDIKDMDQAVTAARSAVTATPHDSPDRRTRVLDLAAMLAQRCRKVGSVRDLVESYGLTNEAATGTPADAQESAARNWFLASAQVSLTRASSRDELDRVIRLLESLSFGFEVTDSSSGPAAMSTHDHARRFLASALDLRWQYYRDVADLRRSTDLLGSLLGASAADDPMRQELLSAFSMAVFRLGEETGDAASLDRALNLIGEALALPSTDAEQTGNHQRNLAVMLKSRARRDGEPADLEAAIELLEGVAYGPAALPVALTSLGMALLDRHELTESAADLDRAVEVLTAATTAVRGAFERISALEALHAGTAVRYRALGRPDDLESMRALQKELRSAGDVPHLQSRLSHRLADVLDLRYAADGDPAALREAVATLDAELTRAEPGSARRRRTAAMLAQALWMSYVPSGDDSLLERAISLLRETVGQQQVRDDAYAQALSLLGACLRDRYVRRGDAADLDEAIDCYKEALSHLDPTAATYAEINTNFGLALWDKYGRTGSLYDLDRSIATMDLVLNTPSRGGKKSVTALNTLGIALRDRFRIAFDPRDIHRAVAAYEEAFGPDLAQSDTVSPGTMLNNYGAALMDRYAHSSDLADLVRGIQVFEQSIEVAPPGSTDRPRFLVNLAGGLQARYERLRDIADVDRAVRLIDDALTGMTADWINRPNSVMGLAGLHRTRYLQMGRRGDRERALELYRTGCSAGLGSQPGATLFMARDWTCWVFDEGAWSDATEACDIAFQAMTQLFETQFGRRHKEHWLRMARGIPARAAYARAMTGASEEAVVAVERGLALQLSEVLERDRAQFDDLVAGGHGELVSRYRQANDDWSDRLRAWESAAATGTAPVPAARDEDVLRRTRLELDASIAEIRGIRPDFLLPTVFADIADAARDVPLVYLVATDAGGVALLVGTDGAVETAWLPHLTEGDVVRRVSDLREAHDGRKQDPDAWRGRLDAVTAWLWDAAMGSVTGALGRGAEAVLVPVGHLGLLPLHAAWTPDDSRPVARRYAMDDCVLSYAPNARSLRTAKEIADRVPLGALLSVHDPRPTKQDPPAFADAEVAAAQQCFAISTGLRHGDASVSGVTAVLADYPVHHFACHGVANLSEPLLSALILAGDEPLSLGELLRLRLTGDGTGGVRLAVLSACESQVPGLELPDEAVSLPTGLLQAGVAGVIASQWAVRELATCLLMTRFHQALAAGGSTPAAALRAAQRWVRDTTNQEKADTLKDCDHSLLPAEAARTMWRALIRKPPRERSFAHVSDWAAFSHLGV
ncbi:hypothetical protein AR457_06610 [Streptomyces agglomeratus]|uniref:CHAT domain-containing protein n=1 Tax=Streptomyces agglomeratus TaxID=285458 RepID=UPI00085450D6|nr:CHAT domain-containing protein [Streptomyces agglomeratus]OEJ41802.1 hypothetical protein BGK70_30035 [Streptomyces agglomeratus]OEJ43820.1 hypothetical protein AR457_06610 [Streptomyces agglomeratus]